MNSSFRQIINTCYILILSNFFLCCSDANDMTSSAESCDDEYSRYDEPCFREYNEDYAGEEAGSLIEDMELSESLDASSAPEECNYLASHTSDSGKISCLDLITLPLLDSEDPLVWCEQTEALNLTLEGVQTSGCHDRDGDCWYECDYWQLPSAWQDPDDRRSAITGVVEDRMPQAAPPTDDSPTVSPTVPEMEGSTNTTLSTVCVNQALGGALFSDSQLSCRHELFEQPLQIFACEKDAFIGVYRSADQFELVLQRISGQILEEDYRVYIDFVPQSALCTLDANQAWTALLFGEQPYEVYELFGQRIAPVVYEATAQALLDNLSPDFTELKDANVNQQGLQTWSYSLGSAEDPAESSRHFAFMRLDQGLVFGEELTQGVVAQQFLSTNESTIRDLNLRSAYLNSDNSVSLKDEDQDFEYELFSQFKPFQDLKSSELFLALVPKEPADSMNSEVQRLFFSLWGDATQLTQDSIEASLLDFPLVFDALFWGYNGVILSKITGNKALLKLRLRPSSTDEPLMEPSEVETAKYIWGVYDILTDRLQVFELIQLSQALGLPVEEELSSSEPNLHSSWLTWMLKYNDTSYLIAHELSQ